MSKPKKKAKTYCIAAGCRNNDKNWEHSFFSLPSGRSEKETERCLQWVTLLGRVDILDRKNLHKNAHRVCSAHFDISAMKTIQILHDNAIPTLFLADQPQDGSSCSTVEPIATQDAGILLTKSIESQTSISRIPSTVTPRDKDKVLSNILLKKNVETQTTEKVAVRDLDKVISNILLKKNVETQTTEKVAVRDKDKVISKKLFKKNVETQTTEKGAVRDKDKVISNKVLKKNVETQTTKKVALEKSTQTSKLLTEETQRKRKLLDEPKKESKSKQRRLSHEIIKIQQELEATNHPITRNDPDDEITRRFQKLIDWQNKLKNKYKGKQYEAEYKLFALNLHYSNPHAYRCLQTILNLPSKTTLNRLKMLVPPTLDNRTLDSLALKIKSLPDSAKYCTICVDEMTLKSNLYYNLTSDEVIGFNNVNGNISPEIANHAFVIMLQGIYCKWKQPIAYALLATAKHYEEIDRWLNEVISKLSTIGIHVKAIVSDQGSNFDKFAKDVKKVTIDKPYFIYDNTKIYYIFNVPHLVKCIRNELLTSDFILDGNKISWEYITRLYNDQKDRNLRLMPKITEAHIQPNNFQKMRVKLAAQILSRTVAAALHTYIDLSKFSEEARPTAAFIESMNNLFDVLNSSRIKCNNKFQAAFRLSEDQEIALNSAKEMFAAVKAINRKTGKNNTEHINTFVNFQISIQSITMLFEDLRKDGFEYLLTRRLNKDNLEKFFGRVQQMCESCKPSPIKFQRAFSKLLLCEMMKNTPNTNCEMDFCDVLLKAEDMMKSKLSQVINLPTRNECRNRNPISLAGETDYRMDLPDENALTYVSGYLFFKCTNTHNCSAIDEISRVLPGFRETNLFSRYKAYNKQTSFHGSLKMPPKEFMEYVKELESVFTQHFEKLIQTNPGSKLIELFQSVPPQTPCACFPEEYLIKLFARLRIFATIKFNNRQFKDGKKGVAKYLKVSHL